MGIFQKDRDLTRPPHEVRLRVEASALQLRSEDVHVRLDQFLSRHLRWRSRSSIQSLIREGHVLVDLATPDHPRGTGEAACERRPGRKLHDGTAVVVVIPEELRLASIDGSEKAIEIVYEDREVVAVDKPPMVAVHPSGRHLADTLIQRVHRHYRSAIEAGDVAPRLCHRLDRETSGIVLIGKRPRTHRRVMKQFERRRVEKEYLAIVHGVLGSERGTIDYALAPARASRIGLKIAVAVDGLAARTDWIVVARYDGYTLVRCVLHTGRQHQIRVHLATIGHPIVGDKLYGDDDELFQKGADGTLAAEDLSALELPRQALHNHRLAFVTPDGDRTVEVISPLAPDLEEFLEGRRRLE